MASGFLIASRRNEIGIHLPLNFMLELSGILYHVDLSRLGGGGCGIFFKGPRSLLFPSAYDEQCPSIQWHLETSEDELVSPGLLKDRKWFRISSMETVKSAKCFLGYCSDVNIHLGTPDRVCQYPLVKNTNANEETARTILSFSQAQAQIGLAGVGNVSATGTITQRNGLRGARPDMTVLYDDVLKYSPDRPMILFDTERTNERGWMVSQLSVILDLVNYWIWDENTNHNQTNQAIQPVTADLSSDGGAAARNALQVRPNANRVLRQLLHDDTDDCVKHQVLRIYAQISCREELAALYPRGLPPFSVANERPERLLGWDLLDILDPLQPITRLKMDLHKTSVSKALSVSPSWLALTHHIPVLFYQGLGQVIQPAYANIACDKWDPIPGGFLTNYLTVSMASLAAWSKPKAAPDCYKPGNGLYWDLTDETVFQDCRESCLKGRKECSKQDQVLRTAKDGYTYSVNEIAFQRAWLNGAVVFGMDETTKVVLLREYAKGLVRREEERLCHR